MDLIAQLDIPVGRADVAQVIGKSSHAGRDRHIIVVEDDDRQVPGPDQSQCGTDRIGTVPGIEDITFALPALGESAETVQTPESVKSLSSSRQYFVRITLVSHVPDDPVLRKMKRYVERHRKFDHTEIAGKVPTGNADFADQEIPDLRGKIAVRFLRYFLYVIRFVYLIKKCHQKTELLSMFASFICVRHRCMVFYYTLFICASDSFS